jgi:3-oxoacyl-[acyl-carrier-protein] synthase II
VSWTITGTGAVASIGANVDELFDNLCAGVSGLAPLRAFDPSRYRVTHAYEVDDRPPGRVDIPGRATRLLIEAVRQAADRAGLGGDLGDVPILIGTGLRELRSVELHWRDGVPLDLGRLHFGPALREHFGAIDTHTFANACAASLYALGLGTDLLSLSHADTVIVAGVDVLTESMCGLLERVHPVPPDRVRPFDRNRRGVLMGDGAAAIVLRSEPDTTTPALAAVRSVAINCDAYHVTAPDTTGIAGAVREAHRRAGVKPEDVDLILTHGTGTLLNDEAEATALSEVYGAHAGRPLVTAIKSMTGHTSGASGLMNVVVAVEAMRRGLVPPTIGLDDPVDEAAGFRFVRDGATSARVSLAQIDAFGFGGINAVAMVEAAR